MIQHWLGVTARLDQHQRRLAKYSRYNRSEKGRTRVERYRATPYIVDGLRMGTKGTRNRETSHERLVDKRIAAGEAAMREMLAAYNAKHGIAAAPAGTPAFNPDVRAFGQRLLKTVMVSS